MHDDAEVPELEQALGRVRASDAAADFAHALRYAVDGSMAALAPKSWSSRWRARRAAGRGGPGRHRHGEAFVYLVGKAAPNVAITGFSVRRYPLDKSRYEVLLDVLNTTDAPAVVNLELYGDGKLSDVVRLELAPSRRSRASIQTTRAPRAPSKPALPTRWTERRLPPMITRLRCCLNAAGARAGVSKGNMYLDAALLLDETSTSPRSRRLRIG